MSRKVILKSLFGATGPDTLLLYPQNLQEDGYDVGEVPEDETALMQSVLNDPEAKYNSADLNVAYKMKVDEYQKLCPYAEALEENWGKPPGRPSRNVLNMMQNWPGSWHPLLSDVLVKQTGQEAFNTLCIM